MVLAVAVGAIAYGCLTAYSLKSLEKQRLVSHQNRLRATDHRLQVTVKIQAALNEVNQFASQAQVMGSVKEDWASYDVHVRNNFDFETSGQIIERCRDSGQAYYWPIALEIKPVETDENKSTIKQGGDSDRDV